MSNTAMKITSEDVDKTEAKAYLHEFRDALTGKNGEDLTRLACRFCDVMRINYQSPSQAQAELLRELGTSDISTNILSEFVLSGFRQAPEPWMQLARKSMLNKLLPEDRIRTGRDTGLQQRAEDGAAQRATLAIQKSILSPRGYANILVVTREVIFNQGSNNFISAVREEGASAALTIGDEFIRQLTANGAMLDGNELFHTSHSNIAQSPGAPSVDTINEMMKLLRRMPRTANANSARTNMSLRYILAPAALEMKLRALLTSQFSASNDSVTPVTLLIDSRLDDASTTAWYGFTDPDLLPVFEVAGLRQHPKPNVDSRINSDTQNLEIKTSLDFAAGFIDWRGVVYNAGA